MSIRHTQQSLSGFSEIVKGAYRSLWEPISELWGITCHMGSHSVTCHPTQV